MQYWSHQQVQERHCVYYAPHWHGGSIRKRRKLIKVLQLNLVLPGGVVVDGDVDNLQKVHIHNGMVVTRSVKFNGPGLSNNSKESTNKYHGIKDLDII